jgi:hypothetical protein
MYMNEEELYARAMADVNAGTVEAGLWAKAFALADGEPEKTKAKYIGLWVSSKLQGSASTKIRDSAAINQNHQGTTKNISTCPSCNSQEWKVCSMVFAEGSSTGSTESSHFSIGTGIGRRSGIGIEFGSSDHTSAHQSQLARMAVRPDKPLHPVSQLIMELKQEHSRLLKREFFKGAIERSIEKIKALLVQHEQHDDWHITRMCMQCGTKYVPGKQNPAIRVNRMYELLESKEDDEREEAYRKKIGL